MQTAPAPSAAAIPEEVMKLETFTVTGSNIKRMEMEKVLPVSLMTNAEFEIRGASQPSELLTALPQITGLPGNEAAVAGATARGDNTSVSLRGISSSNPLGLLNGRRLTPHPISQGEAGVPTLSTNVSQLPSRGVEKVEILRDGASSIYGTDAVAGVVNYVMPKNYRGTEISLSAGQTRYGDGTEFRTTLTHGLEFAGGKGRAMVTADYYTRQAMYIRDRSFGADPDNTWRAPAPWNVPTNTNFNLRSTSSEYGSFLVGTAGANDAFGSVAAFTGARPTGVPATMAATNGLFVVTPLTTGGVGFAAATPARTATGPGHDYYWNNSTYRVIQPQTKRMNIFASGEYDLNSRISLFADVSAYSAKSVTYREPDAYSQSTDGFLIVPVTNPYNPFGNRFWSPTGAPNTDGTLRLTGTPAAVSITNKRFTDLETRTAYVNNSLYRGVAGLRGKFGRTWTWESALLWSANRVVDNEAGATRRSLLKAAINQTDPAKAFNPFTRTFAVQNGALVVTGDYKNPDSVTSTFRESFIRNGITKLGSGDIRASGDLFSIWGGNTIGAAVGGEFRYEAFDDYRPAYAGLNPASSGLDPTGNDFVSFSPNSDTHANRHVSAAYAEAVIPLVGREFKLPLVQSLELSASARYESYTDFGSTTKPKYSVNWKPASWLMVRGSYNQGFHAPNLAQLFTGTLIRTLLSTTDTYRNTATGLATDGPSNRRSIAAGNPNLSPEEGTGKSAGVVIDVPRVKGLSVAIDYWEIRQKDIIASGGGIPDDTAALQAATLSALAAGQNINSIDLGSGTPGYKGDPSVVRLPVTQTDKDLFAAFNARQVPGNQRGVVGTIAYINVSYYNKAQQFVNGFDFDVNYRVPQTRFGNFNFNTTWTLLNDFHAYSAPGAPRTEYRETNFVGGATPKWRGNTSISWRRKQWGGGVAFYYIGRFMDTGATTTLATYTALGEPGYIQPSFNNGSFIYRYVVHDSKSYNVFASYRLASQNRWLKDLSVRFHVNNVLDAKPPLGAGSSSGYEVSVYNSMARGRTYSLTLTKKL